MGLDKDEDQFISALYEDMFNKLLMYANTALSNRSLAEEAVQETFRIACMKIDDVKASENSRGWLVLTLKNVIRNMQRELASLNKLFVTSVSIYDENFMEKTADQIDVNKRVENSEVDILYSDLLSPDEYKLLKMIVLYKYSIKEAAAEFGISLETCKKRIQRIKKNMGIGLAQQMCKQGGPWLPPPGGAVTSAHTGD